MIVEEFKFDEAMLVASKKAIEMVKQGLYSRFKLSEAERIDKALLGCMGEFAFEELLKSKGINYKLDETDFAIKNSDVFDFLINARTIDVKVAKKSTPNNPTDNWTYGYPREQNPTSKDYIVVGWVDFAKKEVGFYGWIGGKEVASFPVVEKNTFAGYTYLTPNHEFRWGDLNKSMDDLFRLIAPTRPTI